MNSQAQVDNAYWASLSPAELAAKEIVDPAKRLSALNLLVASGAILDMEIMFYGLDPYWTMRQRMVNGYNFVFAMGDPGIGVFVPPGLSFPGIPTFPDAPPKGSKVIPTVDVVNCDLAVTYPAYSVVPPLPPHEKFPPPYVGGAKQNSLGLNIFVVTQNGQEYIASLKEGDAYSENGHEYRKTSLPSMFNIMIPYWELVN